jgi:Uma2 family endonuclease
MEPARDGRKMTVAEYLALERTGDVRHEYVDGEAFAMAGGSLRHSAVCANVIAALVTALRGRPCRVFQSDARVHVSATGMYTYPDIAVVCGPVQVDKADEHSTTNPRMIVEVLSPGTEAHDRGAKFRHYQSIPTLEEYVLVNVDERRIERYRRVRTEPDAPRAIRQWLLSTYTEAGPVDLESVGAHIELDDVYAQLEGLPG